ncbi:MAG TPA: NAD(P)H-binding protein, partial [Anaeromyxobacteraceae bacterium]
MAGEELHVVFGAGQIGPLLAARLRAHGKVVRVVRKSAGTVPVEGVEVVRGDAMDAAFCIEATGGAQVVYHCMNTPYLAKVWLETLPRLQANLVAAAGRAGARLVMLDNLYALGRTGGRPMT